MMSRQGPWRYRSVGGGTVVRYSDVMAQWCGTVVRCGTHRLGNLRSPTLLLLPFHIRRPHPLPSSSFSSTPTAGTRTELQLQGLSQPAGVALVPLLAAVPRPPSRQPYGTCSIRAVCHGIRAVCPARPGTAITSRHVTSRHVSHGYGTHTAAFTWCCSVCTLGCACTHGRHLWLCIENSITERM